MEKKKRLLHIIWSTYIIYLSCLTIFWFTHHWYEASCASKVGTRNQTPTKVFNLLPLNLSYQNPWNAFLFTPK